MTGPSMSEPLPPDATFKIRGLSPWPFDFRRRTGPWSQRHAADVYGRTPMFVRRLLGRT